ncbi:MAG: acyl-CoA dehydrogenase family protein [Burkholderiaceae bacterium]
MNEMSADERRLVEIAGTLRASASKPGRAVGARERTIGLDALREAAGLGLTGIQVPRAMGGQGASFGCKVAVTQALAQADFGFAMSLVNTHNVAAKLSLEARPEVAGRFVPDLLAGHRLGSTALTELHAGSDFPAIRTRAVRTGDGWQLDGGKAWITNAAVSDVIVLYAHTGQADRSDDIAAFVVDGRRAGFCRLPAFELAGQHTIGTGAFELQAYQAADAEMIQPPGKAFRAALASINGARVYIAAMCCGMVERALAIAIEYGAGRSSFGQPLTGHQGWRWMLAEASAELAAAQALVDRATRATDEGRDTRLLAAQAKVFATGMAVRQLPALQHALGAHGLRDSLPFGRHLAGAQVATLVDGSTEMLLDRIASDWGRANGQA